MWIVNFIGILAICALVWIALILKKFLPETPIKSQIININNIPESKFEGFGIIIDGSLLLNSNDPLIFDSHDQASKHVKDHKLSKTKIIWQKWNIEDHTIFIGKIRNNETFKGLDNGSA